MNRFDNIMSVTIKCEAVAGLFTLCVAGVVALKKEIDRYKGVEEEHQLYKKHLESVIEEDEIRLSRLKEASKVVWTSDSGASFGSVD